MLISGIFSSFGDLFKFWDETSTASFLFESGAVMIFFSVHPLKRTDNNSNIITVVKILVIDTTSFLPVYHIFRLVVYIAINIIIARKPSNPPVFSDGIIVLVSVGTAVMVRVGLATSVSV